MLEIGPTISSSYVYYAREEESFSRHSKPWNLVCRIRFPFLDHLIQQPKMHLFSVLPVLISCFSFVVVGEEILSDSAKDQYNFTWLRLDLAGILLSNLSQMSQHAYSPACTR